MWSDSLSQEQMKSKEWKNEKKKESWRGMSSMPVPFAQCLEVWEDFGKPFCCGDGGIHFSVCGG